MGHIPSSSSWSARVQPPSGLQGLGQGNWEGAEVVDIQSLSCYVETNQMQLTSIP